MAGDIMQKYLVLLQITYVREMILATIKIEGE